MVVRQRSAGHADRLFHALADETRREIVALTMSGEHSVSELARRFPMSFAAVQKHVAVLEGAGLVTKQRRGREQRVRGNPQALREIQLLLDQLAAAWRERIDRIDALLAAPSQPGTTGPPDTGSPPDTEESTHASDRRPEGP
jgi:DNA-binding transcriptional ArsR family regulator